MLQLENGKTYLRADGKLTKIKKTGWVGFLAYQGSDETYYTKSGYVKNFNNPSPRDIVSEYRVLEKSTRTEEQNFILGVSVSTLVGLLLILSLL
jgi:hypothetical protein